MSVASVSHCASFLIPHMYNFMQASMCYYLQSQCGSYCCKHTLISYFSGVFPAFPYTLPHAHTHTNTHTHTVSSNNIHNMQCVMFTRIPLCTLTGIISVTMDDVPPGLFMYTTCNIDIVSRFSYHISKVSSQHST